MHFLLEQRTVSLQLWKRGGGCFHSFSTRPLGSWPLHFSPCSTMTAKQDLLSVTTGWDCAGGRGAVDLPLALLGAREPERSSTSPSHSLGETVWNGSPRAVSFIFLHHEFIQQIFREHWLCAGHPARPGGCGAGPTGCRCAQVEQACPLHPSAQALLHGQDPGSNFNTAFLYFLPPPTAAGSLRLSWTPTPTE